MTTVGAFDGTDIDQRPPMRSDMVFFETPNGGAVFGVGSIAYCGALSHNGYDNSVSRITENVLRRFASPEPIHAASSGLAAGAIPLYRWSRPGHGPRPSTWRDECRRVGTERC